MEANQYTIQYVLYDKTSIRSTTKNKDTALFWLLNNFVQSNFTAQNHIDITKYFENEFMAFETIKIIDKTLVKVNKFNNYVTVYSPFDLEMFKKTELSMLYQLFYNNNTQIIQIPQVQTQQIQIPQVQTQQIQIPQVQTQQIQIPQVQPQQIQIPQVHQVKNIKNINNNNKSDELPKKLPQEFLKEELDDMKNLLDQLKEEKKEFIEKHKEKEEKFLDIDSTKRYEEKQVNKEKEKEKEKFNIFKADIKIYDKLIHEKNFSESFIPQLFEAKYYILKYLFINDYFLDEDKENPSEEIFELYRTLYDYVNNKLNNKEIYETFQDVFNEFDESLPKNKKILTDKQIMETLNEKSDKTEIFKSDATVDIVLAQSDIDTDDENTETDTDV